MLWYELGRAKFGDTKKPFILGQSKCVFPSMFTVSKLWNYDSKIDTPKKKNFAEQNEKMRNGKELWICLQRPALIQPRTDRQRFADSPSKKKTPFCLQMWPDPAWPRGTWQSVPIGPAATRTWIDGLMSRCGVDGWLSVSTRRKSL